VLQVSDNGEKAIEDLTVGDKVLAKDPKTGKLAYKEVVRLFRHQVDELYEVHVNGQTIQTTAEHPFWVVHKGWVEAKNLKTGDKVVTEEGKVLPIEKVVRKIKHTTVYNFEVKDYHTYYVSGLHSSLFH
jgi:intein/homing endonuclease